jgi:endonuclease YncB( thermonuclease family)
VPLKGTLFAFWCRLPVLILCCCPITVGATDCPARQAGERIEVEYVYDGDTVRLADGRRLRFIGINTPEIGHHGQASQPFAAAARTFLNDLLNANNRTLRLQPGGEVHDHYGRLLAHAFLENGSNIAVQLLDAGLATTLVVPPNTWSIDCYQQHENNARAARRGLWSLPDYQPQESVTLKQDTEGFRIVHGRVTKVRHTRYSVWLDLAGMLALHISSKDLVNFRPGYLDSLAGKRVEVRGWIKMSRNESRIDVRHPSAVRVLASESSRRSP